MAHLTESESTETDDVPSTASTKAQCASVAKGLMPQAPEITPFPTKPVEGTEVSMEIEEKTKVSGEPSTPI